MTELELQLQEEVNRLNAQLDGEGTRLIQCRAQVESLEKQCQAMRECSNFLWTIICSAGGGDWSKESDDWQKAACLGREQYHAILSTTASRDYKSPEEVKQMIEVCRKAINALRDCDYWRSQLNMPEAFYQSLGVTSMCGHTEEK